MILVLLYVIFFLLLSNFLCLFSFYLFFRPVQIHPLTCSSVFDHFPVIVCSLIHFLFLLFLSFLLFSCWILSFSLRTSVQCHQPLFISFTTNSLTTLAPPTVPWDGSSLEPESTQSACCVVTVFLCICPLGVSAVSGDEGFVVQRAWLNRAKR